MRREARELISKTSPKEQSENMHERGGEGMKGFAGKGVRLWVGEGEGTRGLECGRA